MTTETEAPKTRELDVAVGGGTVPVGPLGGPAPKTRERLIAEQEVAGEGDREAIEAEKEVVRSEQTATQPLD